MNFIVYNKEGQILRTGSCPQSMVDLQIDKDEFVMEGIADSETMYIKDSKVVNKTKTMLDEELLQFRVLHPQLTLKEFSVEMTSEQIDIVLNDYFMHKIDISIWKKENYKILRKFFYPEITEYVDAVVKQSSIDPTIKAEGDGQRQEYIEKCLMIKQTYKKE